MKRLLLAALGAGLLLTFTAPPPPASACPLICRYVNGHWVCGCG